ncbi:Cof-type HAD-IIB family hydrolase [Acidaminobacter sp. JC074]|uniref:Cof-type HAD-IIB family hydrolase n=1 Tax=Acidaminobacter sp. JC074 TaxID=2530199 RepID=UPI001F107F6B|nr:Cof-type HAD-IIB family hydrolase [Acidaminobacter sp. JC074]
MSDYRLICLDLDGTLLNSKKEIDEESLRVLRQLQERGVSVSIATGRAAFDAKHHADLIGEDTFYMASNGAVIGNNDELILDTSMTLSQKLNLFQAFEKLKIKPVFVTHKHIYISNWFHYIFHKLFYKRGQDDNCLKYVPEMEDLKMIISRDVCKVHKVICFPKWKTVSKKLKKLMDSSEDFELAVTNYNVFEITASGITKGTGTKVLADHLGIDMDRVIAFGDSENDRDMLKKVGLGVAMENAPEAIKKISDKVTLSNNHQGISELLKDEFNL